jgi:hypothetical protein
MKQRKLGQRLRELIRATPLIGGSTAAFRRSVLMAPLLGGLACANGSTPLIDGGNPDGGYPDSGCLGGGCWDSGRWLAGPVNNCPSWITDQTPYHNSASDGGRLEYNTYIDGGYIVNIGYGACAQQVPQSSPQFVLLPDGRLDCAALCCTNCDPDSGVNCNCYPAGGGEFCCLEVTDAGQVAACQSGCAGRAPHSLLPSRRSRARHPVGASFAEAARLEAASVEAFKILGGELRDHGAPPSLLRRARHSAADEIRHVRATAALARRYGARPVGALLGAIPAERSLEAIATENAVEGCVRETYGALVALWQARHAQDPVIAATMSPIAEDETRHAELAWAIASWAEPRLPRAARRRVNAARAKALAALATEASLPVAMPLVMTAGMPSAEQTGALVAGLTAELRGP